MVQVAPSICAKETFAAVSLQGERQPLRVGSEWFARGYSAAVAMPLWTDATQPIPYLLSRGHTMSYVIPAEKQG